MKPFARSLRPLKSFGEIPISPIIRVAASDPARCVISFWLLTSMLVCLMLLPLTLHGQNTSSPNSTSIGAVPFDQLVWREVKNQNGQSLGAISDLLVEVPSGKIAFVVIQPSELYARPKALRPDALSVTEKHADPATLNLPAEDWLNAPRLDWSGLQVTQKTDAGEKIQGSYLQPWIDRKAAPASGKNAARTAPAQPTDGYVSLSNLQSRRVTVPGWDQDGFLNNFLVDWSAKRVTHALVSPEFPAIARPNEPWYAIPMAMLNPPNEQNSIDVKTSRDAIVHAQSIEGNKLRSDVAGVYRFPSGLLQTSMQAAE